MQQGINLGKGPMKSRYIHIRLGGIGMGLRQLQVMALAFGWLWPSIYPSMDMVHHLPLPHTVLVPKIDTGIPVHLWYT